MAKERKIRADFRKNRSVRARRADWTRQFDKHGFQEEAPPQSERLSGKGDLTRRRTVMGAQREGGDEPSFDVQLQVDPATCHRGRVLSVHGLASTVQDEDGRLFHCATRRLLKTLSTEQRNVVAVGDRVLFRTGEDARQDEGFIELVEPRHGTVCREVRGRQQVLVANIDQMLIVTSAAQPRLKPNLVDRLLVTAEKGRVRPLVCINKIDMVEPADLEPLAGVYSRMGYEVMLLSAKTGFGVERLRRRLARRESVLAGQSGVGKSSLLNAIDPKLQLPVGRVSDENEKGRHTTAVARLLPLNCGGYVVDTPGVRQFHLWDVTAEEVASYFCDLRCYVSLCRFPDCTHTHEDDCALKDAVADGRVDQRRYESYCHLLSGQEE